MSVVRVSRREFMALTGMGAGALILGCRSGSGGTAPSGPPVDLNLWVAIAPDGEVSIVAHRSEMGQGSRTSLPAIVADEMGADWSKVRIIQADGDEKYGSQNTDGSRSVRRFYQPLREVGASARHMLITAAATRWGVPADECEARDHRVIHEPSERELGYGELAAEAAEVPVPEAGELKLKSPDEFEYIGQSMPVADLEDYVTGGGTFGIDMRVPGMLYASIERPPVLGGDVASFDDEEALAVRGVRKVVPIPAAGLPAGFNALGGVAVLADNTWAAMEGRRALTVEWSDGPNASYDSAEYRLTLEASGEKAGTVMRERGDVDRALASSARRHQATFWAPHLAHAPMEPPCAVARFENGTVEAWAPTQNPQAAIAAIAAAMELDPTAVTVHVTLLGGGFGRKSKPDYVVEAALLAREAGAPVKVTWSREDEIRHGYYHSVSHQRLEAGLDGEGRPTAWLQRTVFPSIGSTFNPAADRGSAGELSLGCTDLPYDIPNLRFESGAAAAHVRIGWLRSVSNIFHVFAAGSFVDELAHLAGEDPKAYLLELLGEPRHLDLSEEAPEYANYGESTDDYPIDTGRLAGVIESVASSAGWGRDLGPGRGLGIAAHRSFLSYVATVVEVEVGDDGAIRVPSVHLAIDCGRVINPDRVRAQMEGSIVWGLGIALHGEITAREGRIEQSNFHDYRVLRIHETPREMAIELIEHPGEDPLPTGVGEPGVPPVAPALANAIFAATGERRRELPLVRA